MDSLPTRGRYSGIPLCSQYVEKIIVIQGVNEILKDVMISLVSYDNRYSVIRVALDSGRRDFGNLFLLLP